MFFSNNTNIRVGQLGSNKTNTTNFGGVSIFDKRSHDKRIYYIHKYEGGHHSIQFSYETTDNHHRLTRIEHRFTDSSILAAHDYGHAPDGTITRWTQERSSLPTRSWHYGYDAALRLTSATLGTPSPSSASELEAILATHRWQYDPGDNRLATQKDTQGRIPSKYNHLNQLLTQGSGPTRIAGTIDEPGTVTVNGAEAKMRNQTEFDSWLNLPPGTHQIDIAATDHNENTATQSYEITIANEPEKHFEYDLNGNLVERTGPNGTTTYDWDAFDRLIAIHYPDGSSSQFIYDGLSRRVAITEKDDQENVILERKFLWHGLAIAEERSGTTGATVEKRFYHNGVELLTGPDAGLYTYRTDHLGSIREVVGSTGSLIARYDYDAWGVSELVSGPFDLDFKYTGHFYHTPSTLHLAPFRAYDAAIGRWLNRDPITEAGGINLYAYVQNDPTNYIDPLGLDRWICGFGHVAVVVENPNSSTGYTRYEFGPERWWGAIHGRGRLYSTDVERPSGLGVKHIKSTPRQDAILIELANSYNDERVSYNLIGSNCRHHVSILKDAGMAAKHNPLIWTPLFSNPWARPRK